MVNAITQRPGIDGMERAIRLDADGCCAPSICNITPSMLACNFVDALPRGPLWDKPKAVALDHLGPQLACNDTACVQDETCHSIVSHSVYTANRLWHQLTEALWPAIRESDPFTCFDTVDDWLARLGWQDCFNSACRMKGLGDLTPYEVLNGTCRLYSPPVLEPDLLLAVKLGIVRALARLDMGIVPNLASINFVLEPLGAVVTGIGMGIVVDDTGPCAMAPPSDGLPGCDWPLDHPILQICNVAATLPKPVRMRCELPGANEPYPATISAAHHRTMHDDPRLPDRVWPGVLAAECILRSVIYPGQYVEVQRCAA